MLALVELPPQVPEKVPAQIPVQVPELGDAAASRVPLAAPGHAAVGVRAEAPRCAGVVVPILRGPDAQSLGVAVGVVHPAAARWVRVA